MSRNSELVSIVVEWRDEKGDRQSVDYTVAALGEGRARQRATQRIEICRATQQTITAYRFEYADGGVSNAV